MNKSILPIFLFILLWTTLSAQKIKIACVGNSITYGAGVVNREKNAYPAQLQAMLGNNYQVMNFGVSGTTLLKKGNNPYWNTIAYKKALESKPDIVFIKLGTNDSKFINRSFYNEFESDYKELIKSFSESGIHPRIVLLLPIPSFLADSNSIYDPVIKQQIIPRIKTVAYQTKSEIIDLYSLFLDQSDLLPDKIHPSSLGATIIAKRLYEAVKLNEKGAYDIFSLLKEDKKISSFNGFECADFTFSGRACKVVKPKVTAIGKPWVWRARFWGHEPQTDVSLLERGFHVVYCDVAELFGNTEAINLWNKFYNLMQQCGLSKKAVLEGMSRGGVYIYNWALANPGKVACIYADAPVLDLKSWPGGQKSAGAREPWEDFKKDYNLSEEQAINFKNNPLDRAKEIAKLGFPMLHVVGDVDDVVPIAENTTPFEQQVLVAGGNIQVIHKPTINHHPHSLPNPTPITNFILHATGYKVNFAKIPAPGAEYRSGAGWTGKDDWWAQFDNIDSVMMLKAPLDVLFLGNSITQGTGGHRTRLLYRPGFDAFNQVFGNFKWESAGIAGDRTQNVLWRLQNGAYAKARPKVMVLTIGVNNFIDNDDADEIASGILSIVNWVNINMPATKLVLTGPLPTGIKKNEERRKKYNQIHVLLTKVSNKSFVYLPINEPFMLPNGDLDPVKYGSDGIHLQAEGYRAWAQALKPTITKLLDNK
ncbi:G-D-S-L family lipolytic protein [Pedobacter ginsengisoli]|uniref:G-D-S-L family lipolytic protein n=1 Tax=Pedobacter ginsengisoli TaxID=363852 RepID=A0A2D1U2B7_9SPHI|nr:GDSL-type esterase/lipase family protein [Pedobacter ginsengisoli]ATP55746.1 G-D-S-L family lipolytic protein [Pedobacter ginsengisoli]